MSATVLALARLTKDTPCQPAGAPLTSAQRSEDARPRHRSSHWKEANSASLHDVATLPGGTCKKKRSAFLFSHFGAFVMILNIVRKFTPGRRKINHRALRRRHREHIRSIALMNNQRIFWRVRAVTPHRCRPLHIYRKQ